MVIKIGLVSVKRIDIFISVQNKFFLIFQILNLFFELAILEDELRDFFQSYETVFGLPRICHIIVFIMLIVLIYSYSLERIVSGNVHLIDKGPVHLIY